MLEKCEKRSFSEIPPMEEVHSIRYFLSTQSARNYCQIETKLTAFVTQACKALGMKFQENSSNGSRDTAKKVVCSPSKVPLIIDWSQTKLSCEPCSQKVSWGVWSLESGLESSGLGEGVARFDCLVVAESVMHRWTAVPISRCHNSD